MAEDHSILLVDLIGQTVNLIVKINGDPMRIVGKLESQYSWFVKTEDDLHGFSSMDVKNIVLHEHLPAEIFVGNLD